MNTFSLMLRLSSQKSKSDYMNLVQTELTNLINHFTKNGYNININHGMVGQQTFKTMQDLYTYNFFRDVHFIYWGLNGNWNTNDPLDELYYRGLEGFVSTQYSLLP